MKCIISFNSTVDLQVSSAAMNDEGEAWHYTSIMLYTKACLGPTVQLKEEAACSLLDASSHMHYPLLALISVHVPTPYLLFSIRPPLLHTVLPPYWSLCSHVYLYFTAIIIYGKPKNWLLLFLPLGMRLPIQTSLLSLHPTRSISVGYITANWMLYAWPICGVLCTREYLSVSLWY